MTFRELYNNKRTTAEEAVRLVHDGDFIVVPTAAAVYEAPALVVEFV